MRKIERAFISVSDKEGIEEFASELSKLGIEIISTSKTAKFLVEKGIKIVEVSDYIGYPELMGGLVKTLHPKIHAGILSERTLSHQKELDAHKIKNIDLVVVNLYPFEQKPSRENIDIGGVTLIRSAAKNYEHVAVIVDKADYQNILNDLKANNGILGTVTLRRLAVKAFGYISYIDSLIYNYLNKELLDEEFPQVLSLSFQKVQDLRYGENPHQSAAFYKEKNFSSASVVNAKQIHGKELSFNNILDANEALELVREFSMPTAVIIKHTNPSGVASRNKLSDALRAAYDADPESAFGGVVALNRNCDSDTARIISQWFVELVICPEFDKDSFEILRQKKNIRLLETGNLGKIEEYNDIRRVVGGVLAQTTAFPENVREGFKVVTNRKPTEKEWEDIIFAFNVNKHVKSNAIIFAKDLTTVGIGPGQTSRVFSTRIASMRSGEKAKGAVMSSDAFFPFRDSVDEAAKAGISAIIQTVGSVRDKEIIDAANENNIAMIFSGIRLFKH